MINRIVFSDEITLWWDKEWDLPDGIYYKITLNGDTVVTKKTHVSFKDLTPATAYTVTVARCEPAAVLMQDTIKTPAAKRRIAALCSLYTRMELRSASSVSVLPVIFSRSAATRR